MKITTKQLRKLIESSFEDDDEESGPSIIEQVIDMLEYASQEFDGVNSSYGSRAEDYERAGRNLSVAVDEAVMLLRGTLLK